jgi:hypothetical protein
VTEELRDLERAVATGGGAAERLRLASALERSGRKDDALAVLVPAREDAEVRRAIGRFPAWTHPDGDAGASGAVDLEPIRERPRVKWTREVGFRPRDMAANAATVFVYAGSAIDAETGQEVWNAGSSLSWAFALVCDVLLGETPQTFEALDSWTGRKLHETPNPGGCFNFDEHGIVACAAKEDRVLSYAFDDPRSPPKLARDLVVDFDVSGRCMLAPDRIVFGWRSGAVIVERETLAVVARMSGRPLRIEDGALVVAGREGLVDFDLVTGRQLPARFHRMPTLRLDGPPSLVARARDVFVLTDREALSAEADGKELWRIPGAELPTWPIYHLALGSRRIYASGGNGVFCLEALT